MDFFAKIEAYEEVANKRIPPPVTGRGYATYEHIFIFEQMKFQVLQAVFEARYIKGFRQAVSCLLNFLT
jgi:hypothetical protein